MKYVTYRIIDPRDKAPIYIGQSKDYGNRIKLHIRRAKKSLPKTKTLGIKAYLVLLYSEGYEPEFEIVDINSSEEESLLSERHWVEKTVKSGFPVLNRWRDHRSIVNKKYGSREFKLYFCARFPSEKVIRYALNDPENESK